MFLLLIGFDYCLPNNVDQGRNITEAAEQTIQKQGKTEKNEWWDNDCKKIINGKNEARKKFLQTKTRASQEQYKSKRKEANKILNFTGQKAIKWKPIGTRARGRPKSRWEEDVLDDLRKMKVNLNQAKDRAIWKKHIEKAKTFNFEVVEP
ncbi:hypothetical protein C0J52_06267 [Blattella germanica]|nr:hypothetical protein C0J52_06267 [Blattella germanica]